MPVYLGQPHPVAQERALERVRAERARQRSRGHTAKQDDARTDAEFAQMVHIFADMVAQSSEQQDVVRHFTQVAAVAVAALERYERRTVRQEARATRARKEPV